MDAVDVRTALTVNPPLLLPHVPVSGDPGELETLATETLGAASLTTRVSCADAVLAGDWLSLAVTTTMNVFVVDEFGRDPIIAGQ